MIWLHTGIGRSLRGWALLLALIIVTPISALAQATKQVTAGPEYAGSPSQRRWFGDGYRDVWTMPFDAPVVDLSTDAGGLEPVRVVGQLQTAGLALRGADGKSYTFRSLHKEPERLLPPEWRNSWPAKMLRDATSATHPGAAVMLPVLAEAAGIPHTQPRLVVLPDDPRLGKFRETFANQLGTLEEYPTAAGPGYGGFENATQIISTGDLWTAWLQGPENRIDTRAFLRARILDLFVENYDRRRGQWRWMRIPGKERWQPLPEDPDMVFVRHDGLMMSFMRSRQPRLLEFSDKYAKNLEGPTSNAAEVDRWLLTDLQSDVFEQTARELQAVWTDEVIDRTIAQLPKEWQALDKGFLAGALRARRAGLVEYVRRFYRYLARDVDVHLTDRDERVTIATAADGSTTLTVSASGAARVLLRGGSCAARQRRCVSICTAGTIGSRGPGRAARFTSALSPGQAPPRSNRPTHRQRSGPALERLPAVESIGLDPGHPDSVKDAPWLEPRSYGSWTISQPSRWSPPMSASPSAAALLVPSTVSGPSHSRANTPSPPAGRSARRARRCNTTAHSIARARRSATPSGHLRRASSSSITSGWATTRPNSRDRSTTPGRRSIRRRPRPSSCSRRACRSPLVLRFGTSRPARRPDRCWPRSSRTGRAILAWWRSGEVCGWILAEWQALPS